MGVGVYCGTDLEVRVEPVDITLGLNGSLMKNFVTINCHDTSPLLLMWQCIYEERER